MRPAHEFKPSPEVQAFFDKGFECAAYRLGINDETKAKLDRIIESLPIVNALGELEPSSMLFASMRAHVARVQDEDLADPYMSSYFKSEQEIQDWRDEGWKTECEHYYHAYHQAHTFPALLREAIDEDNYEAVKTVLPFIDQRQLERGILDFAEPPMREFITTYFDRQALQEALPEAWERRDGGGQSIDQARTIGRTRRL